MPSPPSTASTTNPFAATHTAPVAGGRIAFAHAGPPPDEAEQVVLAVHGVTSNLMVWGAVARVMGSGSRASFVAPDLRGRADSASVPGPYGIAAHVADMLAILDHLGVERAVLAGHSMGAYVAARLAAEHPDRVAALILMDGGVPVPELDEETAANVRGVLIGPAMARRALTFTSIRDYLFFWRQHPALTAAWNADLEAYVLHDVTGREPALRYGINVNALQVDSEEMLFDAVNRTSIERARAPVHVLRAPRGALDDDNPLIPQPALDAFMAAHPAAVVEQVEGVNHYTLLVGNSPGPSRVAAAIEAAARLSRTG
jgi:pimeloyl-ACP methyl ester carboxylesterase